MVETHLHAAGWLMVALIAAFTVWMCLTVIGAAIQYERNRRNLTRNVEELRRRYWLSFPDVIMPPGTARETGPGRRAA